jgi:hypothetical protein
MVVLMASAIDARGSGIPGNFWGASFPVLVCQILIVV